MDGDVKKARQLVPVPKFIIPEGLDGAELIPVDLGGRLVPPSISINELGKQLLKASIEGNVDEIKMLMNKGAPFTADWLGTSPLHFAAQNNHLEVCEILLRAGISKDARTKVDRTPLHIAVYEGNIEIVKCLLRNRADIDCKDLLAMTPLHWAVQNCHAEITALLVRQGAQTNVVNKFNLTPLDIAMQCNRPDIAEVINKTVQDPEIAAQNLAIEMSEMDNSSDSVVYSAMETLHQIPSSPLPIETVMLEDDSENSIDPERLHINQEDNAKNSKIYGTPFTERHNPEVVSFSRLLECFLETESVDYKKDERTKTAANEENQLTDLLKVTEHPNISQARVGEKVEIKVAVHNISAEPKTQEIPDEASNEKFSESIKLLQQHGITMLPADDTNILSSILETGHSVVLTEVGKQVLNSTKPVESSPTNIAKLAPKIRTLPTPVKPKKVITVTPQEFIAMTLNQGDVLKQLNGKFLSTPKPAVKRIVMRKNKIVPITTNANVVKISKSDSISDVEMLTIQLIEAKKLVEEYKQKFLKKEAEAERYKKQLLRIAQSKHNYC